MAKKGRVFSGARPTGRQHLGNYLGAIKNYVALQDDYECVYCIVDLHALTTVDTTENLRQNTYEMALDWLAAGIRPEETIMFVQSQVFIDGSPIGQFENIEKPVLVLHGLLDDVVPPEASEEIVHRLKKLDKTFEYKTYPGEPHGFLQRETLMDVYERIERFLDWYLMP